MRSEAEIKKRKKVVLEEIVVKNDYSNGFKDGALWVLEWVLGDEK
jgi:hypothetical protein